MIISDAELAEVDEIELAVSNLNRVFRANIEGRSLADKRRIVEGMNEAIDKIRKRDISFDDATNMIERGIIMNSAVAHQLQADARPGNTIVTLLHFNGREFNVEAQYDPMTNQIYPPL